VIKPVNTVGCSVICVGPLPPDMTTKFYRFLLYEGHANEAVISFGLYAYSSRDRLD
jgi:hypothetical protein